LLDAASAHFPCTAAPRKLTICRTPRRRQGRARFARRLRRALTAPAARGQVQ